MRRRLRPDFRVRAILVVALLSGALLGACMKSADQAAVAPPQDPGDGIELFFRDASLDALSDQGLPEYPNSDPGESTRIARDFPDAPPQISHSVADLYPITRTDNECLECHHPENAMEDDIPVPESHFLSPVMGEGDDHDPMVWVVKDYERLQDVMGGRYNCNMCHTPQATNVTTPSNRFEPPRSGN